MIGGWTDPQGARGAFGALHLGVYDGERAGLRRQGRHRASTSATLRAGLGRGCSRSRAPTSPFDGGTPTGPRPSLGRAAPRRRGPLHRMDATEGGIRHPAFLGLRDDKRREDCRREAGGSSIADSPGGRAATPGRAPTRTKPPPASGGRGGRGVRPARPASRVVVTNPTKVFWPDEGYTKADLVGYYERGRAVAAALSAGSAARADALSRRDRRASPSSRRTRRSGRPRGSARERIRAEDVERDIDYFVVDDVETLRYVANIGTIPLHLWASRLPALERPDWLVLDLDPKGAPFTDVVQGRAGRSSASSSELELPSYPKTSGRDRPAHPAAAGRALLLRGDADVRAPARHAGRRGAAGDLDDRPDDPHARRQGLRRLRPERPRPDDRRAVLGAAAARGAGLVAAASGRR